MIWLKYCQYHTINQSIDRLIVEHHRKVFLCIQRGVIILDTKHHPKDMMKMVKICKVVICYYLIDIFIIFDLYYISCIYVKPMNCMVPGNKQSNLYIETQLFPKNCQTSIQNIYLNWQMSLPTYWNSNDAQQLFKEHSHSCIDVPNMKNRTTRPFASCFNNACNITKLLHMTINQIKLVTWHA